MTSGTRAGRERTPVTVVVLTFNEERNLAACLASVRDWAVEVVVVDSGSTDRTTEIAARYGATVVVHPFETHARQWQWALETLRIGTPWILGLDADQVVTPELARGIGERLSDAKAVTGPRGYYVRRRQVFRGRWIRHGGYYPKYLLKLFHRDHVRLDPTELVDHHFHVDGPTAAIEADLIEDNRNEAAIAVWIAKHNRYAALQAAQEVAALGQAAPPFTAVFGSPDARTRWLKHAWAHLPLFVRPCLYVTYRYVVRLGVLDGKQGFVFHVLQAFWYRLLVDINIDELCEAARQRADPEAAPPAASAPSAREARPESMTESGRASAVPVQKRGA